MAKVVTLPIPRYDALLVYCLALTFGFWALRLETWREVLVIFAFHLVGLGLELFKVHIGAWSYPGDAWAKVAGVPLFAGFMYASVGSYICQAWRRFDLRVSGYRQDAHRKPDDGDVRPCHLEVMDIRQVDVFDDTELERLYEVTDRAEAFERPHHSRLSLDEAKLELRRQDPTERAEAWAAYDDDAMVGGVSLWFPLLDNLTKCWGALGVDPDQRRRGVGSALVAQIVTRMEQEGRTIMVTESAYPLDRRQDHPYRRFAEANGFTVAIDEIRRILPLPVDPALLRTLATQAAPHHTAYRIESFVDDLPAGLLASYCALRNRLGVDAPTGGLDFEAESMTPQLLLERVAEDKDLGRTRLTTLAIEGTGNVVAYSDLILPPVPSQDVWQWGTLVHRDHRGHRLGMAVKVANLEQLAAADPARVRVLTCNAETNRHMVDINERLGFEAIEVCPMLELRIDKAVATPTEQRVQVGAATTGLR